MLPPQRQPGGRGIAAAAPAAAQETLTMSVPPVVSQDHAALLASDDPQLAANKQLVYDMYRIVLQGGHWDRAHEFIAEGYIQHNPNAAQGLAGPDGLCPREPPGARDQGHARPAADHARGRGRLRHHRLRPPGEGRRRARPTIRAGSTSTASRTARSPSTGTRCSRATRRSIRTTSGSNALAQQPAAGHAPA